MVRDLVSNSDDERIVRSIADHANHFRMIGITRDDHVTAVSCSTFGQPLHASYKGTGGIDNLRRALFQFGLNLRRHTVRPNDRDFVLLDLAWVLDGSYAF